jgi:hypothetical protein
MLKQVFFYPFQLSDVFSPSAKSRTPELVLRSVISIQHLIGEKLMKMLFDGMLGRIQNTSFAVIIAVAVGRNIDHSRTLIITFAPGCQC